jgi:hypothetical protein
VGNGEITVMMNGAWSAKRNKISLHPWPVHLYLAIYSDQGGPGESTE